MGLCHNKQSRNKYYSNEDKNGQKNIDTKLQENIIVQEQN